MLLQDLVRYYEIIKDDPDCKIPEYGYSLANVSFVAVIGEYGNLKTLLPLKVLDENGKKYVPCSMKVPQQLKKSSSVNSNFMCENASYTFGLDIKSKLNDSEEKRNKSEEKALLHFQNFKKKHLKLLSDIEDKEVLLFLKFIKSWNPEKSYSYQCISENIDDLKSGGSIIFQTELNMKAYLHENHMVRKTWDRYMNVKDGVNKMCLVTGREDIIERLHPSIKGLYQGQSMGNSMVSFNARAYESYGKEKMQGLNAPVGVYASFAYATTLNYMLKAPHHRLVLGDSTIVFWAESADKGIQDFMSLMFDPTPLYEEEGKVRSDTRALIAIRDGFKNLTEGKPFYQSSQVFETTSKVVIVGISPNAARISIRFFIEDSLGNFTKNVSKHYDDLKIEKQYSKDLDFIPLWRLVRETIPSTSTEKKASPLLSGAIMRAILNGTPYPNGLYQTIILRIRAEKNINYIKASIIKAYLLRNQNNNDYEEVLVMALNEQSDNKAYVLGRLFAVLEKTQEDASPGIKASIKDSFFSSASTTPLMVFPRLLKLSNHHIRKSDFGNISEKRINGIMDKLSVDNQPFPASLSMEEQGIFILGYYHQKNSFYKKVKED